MDGKRKRELSDEIQKISERLAVIEDEISGTGTLVDEEGIGSALSDAIDLACEAAARLDKDATESGF